MRSPRLGLTAVVVAALLAGCEEADDERPSGAAGGASAPPSPVRFEAPRGLPGDLLLAEGRLRFLPCGQGVSQPLDDETGGEARRAIGELGFGDDAVRAVVVMDGGRLLEVRHAAPEAVGCEGLVPEGDLQARGNEPFWNVRVAGDEALWRTPDAPDGIPYVEGAWERAGEGGWRFEARRVAAGGAERLVLELVQERCRDSMAGSWFPYSARVERAGETFTGCALEGRGSVGEP